MTPDVIVPSSNLVTTILQQETRTIPIVFVAVGDPVGSGYVASIAQPGGNITGFANWENTIAGKWVEALNEIAHQVRRVGFILHPETRWSANLAVERHQLLAKLTQYPGHNRIDPAQQMARWDTPWRF
jgi:ABC-type uncharacterized transport system substrate-binding protein